MMLGCEKQKKTETDLELEYSKSLPVEEKRIRPILPSQRVQSYWAFLNMPLLPLDKATTLAI